MKDFTVLFVVLALSMVSSPCWSMDQDDGIDFDKPIDDSIRPDVNLNYVVQKAKARSGKGSSSAIAGAKGGAAGVGNINFGLGSRLKNVTIINKSDNSGAAAIAR